MAKGKPAPARSSNGKRAARSRGKGIKKKAGLSGNAVQYVTRNQALKRLQART